MDCFGSFAIILGSINDPDESSGFFIGKKITDDKQNISVQNDTKIYYTVLVT